jgi:hypothetical protein
MVRVWDLEGAIQIDLILCRNVHCPTQERVKSRSCCQSLPDLRCRHETVRRYSITQFRIRLKGRAWTMAILHAKEPGNLAQSRQSAVNFLKALQAGTVPSIEELKRLLQQR